MVHHSLFQKCINLAIIMFFIFPLFITISRAQAVAQPAKIPTFESAPCMFKLPAGIVEGQDVKCGYVTVYEFHADPQGRTIRLAVAILKSISDHIAPDPFVMAQGGPGGATIDTYVDVLLSEKSKLLADRDIILFDQRGTGYSQPSLACPEIFDLLDQTIEKDLSTTVSLQMSNDAALKCRTRLITKGVNLAAYNSLENAADIEDLRKALGYSKINLYGVSYGTLLVLHTLQLFPDGLRSVVIDSVVPPQVNFLTAAAKSQDRAFTELFNACGADPACNSTYPNLEKVLFDQVKRLNDHPATIQMTDDTTGKKYDKAVLNGDSFESSIFQMMYATELIPYLPKVIYDASRGEYSFLSRIMSLLNFDRSVSYGMYYSVICAEEADYKVTDVQLGGVRLQIAAGEKENAESLLQLCEKWNVPNLPPQTDEPVKSDVPVLVLNGRFDPITPPSNGDLAAATLSHSYEITFPTGGHGAATSGDCQDQIILSFLKNPTKTPDSSCIARQPAPDFISGKNTVFVPVLYRLLNLQRVELIELLFFGLGVLFLLTTVLIYPIVWLVRILRRKPQTAKVPWIGHLSHLSGIITAILIAVFFSIFVYAGFQLAAANNLIVFFGFPISWRLLFFLPLIIAALILLMTVGTFLAWTGKYRSLPETVYETLLLIAALDCAIILFLWGTFQALFIRG